MPFVFPENAALLDIGCGVGNQLAEAVAGFKVGVDVDPNCASKCQQRGIPAILGKAEHLPITDRSFDGVICKVVLPLTVEDLTIAEIARVLRSGGKCYLITIGSGYYLRYLLLSRSLKYRFYGLRTLINTWVWVATHRRLPGFVGDTTYQSRRRLRRYFKSNRLQVVKEQRSSFFGLPVFIYTELDHTWGSVLDAWR